MQIEFWQRPSVQATVRYLEAWGEVQRARLISGDPTCIPKPDDYVGAGARGKPSNLPDIALASVEVDCAINELPYPGDKLMQAVLFLHYGNFDDYEDEFGVWHRRYSLNWDSFTPAIALDIAEKLGLTLRDLKVVFERMHKRFVERFAKSRQPQRTKVAA